MDDWDVYSGLVKPSVLACIRLRGRSGHAVISQPRSSWLIWVCPLSEHQLIFAEKGREAGQKWLLGRHRE